MSLPDGNPRIPEGINARDDNPLREFLVLAAGISGALVLTVFLLGMAVHYLAPFIPFRWEASVLPESGLPLAGEDAGEAGAALARLGEALLASSLRVPVGDEMPAEQVPPRFFRFHLSSLAEPNAFATLGANIAVTTPLLQSVQTENGLAMVLAHEIAHVQLRHPVEAASRGVVIQIVLAALLGSDSGSLWGGSLGSSGLFTMLSFNRQMELAADRRALAILREHYGHTAGADEFFRKMQSKAGDPGWSEFTRTHPDTGRRLELIRASMADDPAGASTRPLPAELRLAP